MTASCRDAGSSVLLAVPVPLKFAEMKIQPSVARVKMNSALAAIEEARSSSATRLFRFFSPGDANVGSADHASAQNRNGMRPEVICVAFIRKEQPPFFPLDATAPRRPESPCSAGHHENLAPSSRHLQCSVRSPLPGV